VESEGGGYAVGVKRNTPILRESFGIVGVFELKKYFDIIRAF
jgi:hypothetical protein